MVRTVHCAHGDLICAWQSDSTSVSHESYRIISCIRAQKQWIQMTRAENTMHKTKRHLSAELDEESETEVKECPLVFPLWNTVVAWGKCRKPSPRGQLFVKFKKISIQQQRNMFLKKTVKFMKAFCMRKTCLEISFKIIEFQLTALEQGTSLCMPNITITRA